MKWLKNGLGIPIEKVGSRFEKSEKVFQIHLLLSKYKNQVFKLRFVIHKNQDLILV